MIWFYKKLAPRRYEGGVGGHSKWLKWLEFLWMNKDSKNRKKPHRWWWNENGVGVVVGNKTKACTEMNDC